ncbi:hypothetical protein IPM19_03155 [bacterium]|nr:MAG: hypothetical protein IPM19_03155 [bacterium]
MNNSFFADMDEGDSVQIVGSGKTLPEALQSALDVPGVRFADNSFLVDDEAALKPLKRLLQNAGYRIVDKFLEANRNVTNDRNWIGKVGRPNGIPVSRGTLIEQGAHMWDARLKVETHKKCDSCGAYQSNKVIFHGRVCQNCGRVLHYEITQGSMIRFQFAPFLHDKDPHFCDVRMYAYRWSPSTGSLYLFPKIYQGSMRSLEATEAYFHSRPECWKNARRDGKDLVLVKYLRGPGGRKVSGSTIQPLEINKHYQNYSVVQVFQGKEYQMLIDDLPLPESFKIIEAWHEKTAAAAK